MNIQQWGRNGDMKIQQWGRNGDMKIQQWGRNSAVGKELVMEKSGFVRFSRKLGEPWTGPSVQSNNGLVLVQQSLLEGTLKPQGPMNGHIGHVQQVPARCFHLQVLRCWGHNKQWCTGGVELAAMGPGADIGSSSSGSLCHTISEASFRWPSGPTAHWSDMINLDESPKWRCQGAGVTDGVGASWCGKRRGARGISETCREMMDDADKATSRAPMRITDDEATLRSSLRIAYRVLPVTLGSNWFRTGSGILEVLEPWSSSPYCPNLEPDPRSGLKRSGFEPRFRTGPDHH
ncbi:hypothetical protein C8R48DRAFT_672993 [Suillus tomentosus]|nr:hypothetical protein C8R48DRAFT_672993 [Suillus tomentosus]